MPVGLQGDLEQELLGLANALYNLGTTVVSDLTKEKDKPGGGGKQVGMRVYVASLCLWCLCLYDVQERCHKPSGRCR